MNMQHLERGRDGRNHWWRYLLVISITVCCADLLTGITYHVLGDMKSGNASIGLALAIFPFALGSIALVLMVRWLHKRRLAEMINGTRRIRWLRYSYAAAVWMGLQLVALGANLLLAPGDFVFRFDTLQFVCLLLIAIVVLPIQTGFEELLFRGYLAQGIGAGTRSRIAALLVPGLLFGLVHLANPEVEAYGFGIMLANYIASGFVLGLIAALDDGIECAMGVHFANNLFASVFVTYKSSVLATDALFEVQRVYPVVELVGFLAMSAVVIFMLGRRYGWNARTLLMPVGKYPLVTNTANLGKRTANADS